MYFWRWVLGCLFVSTLASGCGGPAEDPAVVSLRSKYLSVDPLVDAVSLSDAAAIIGESPNESEPQTLAVVGRIHSSDLDPWERGKASFVLSELPAEGHGKGHDADNCPFCKRRAAKAPTGIVKFVDAQGETLSIDARKLFGIDTDQVVIVHGNVAAGEFNSLVLVADKMQIVR